MDTKEITPKKKRIGGLDTLRVFGIFLILMYHFFPKWIPGGFLGVNLFFVLSGFLTTHHAILDVEQGQGFSLKQFFQKRYERIVPGLLLMLLISVSLVNFVPSDYRVDIGRQVSAAFSFTTNWYEIVSGGSYEAQFIRHIFVHTWFLAVEVHFYIIWGLLLFFLEKVARKLQKRFKSMVLLLSMTLAGVSYLVLWVGNLNFHQNVTWLYLSDASRLSAFFLGAYLACNPLIFRRRHQYAAVKRKGCYGLLFLLSLIFRYQSPWTYLFGFLMTDILVMFLIQNYYTSKKQESQWISTLAKASYGVYLFHWPLLVIVSSRIKGIWGYVLVCFSTILLVGFQQRIWEPLWKGERMSLPILRRKAVSLQRYLPFLGVISLLPILLFTVIADLRSPQMISLQKEIWVNALYQDLEKIERDYNQLQEALGVESEKAKEEELEREVAFHQAIGEKTITIIGDSVLLGMREYLMTHIPNVFVDAEKSRFTDQGLELIQELKKDGRLGDYVVIALGTNVRGNEEVMLDKIVEEIPPNTHLIFVTPYDGNFQEQKGGMAMRKIAKKHKFITIMDWEKIAKKNPEFYEETDGIHFFGREIAYQGYVRALKQAIIESGTRVKK